MKNIKIKRVVGSRATKTISVFKNEDDVFSKALKKHRHDKSFFISIAEKAGIYDSSGKLESCYKR